MSVNNVDGDGSLMVLMIVICQQHGNCNGSTFHALALCFVCDK